MLSTASTATAGRQRQRIAAHEFARHVGERTRARRDGLGGEMALDVGGECLHRRITIAGLFFERLGDDGIQVAVQRTGFGGRRHAAHQRRLDVQHFVFVGAERMARGRVRTAPVSISNRMTPSEYTSVATVMGWPVNCSGAA